jgi:deoxyribodipyrimidine photo-lyase
MPPSLPLWPAVRRSCRSIYSSGALWALPEHSRRQFDFLMDSLTELDEALTERGARLIVRKGDALDILADLHRRHGIEAIHMYEESGLPWMRARDRAVRRWAVQAGISLREQSQPGVLRGLKEHDDWAARWADTLNAPRIKAPDTIRAATQAAGPWPIAEDFCLGPDDCAGRQKGGRTAGVELLRSFLAGRGRRYRQDADRPVTAETAGSRLSPHLAFGTVSVREAWQAAARARAAFLQDGDTTYAASLSEFLERLEWRARSIQAFEDRPLPQTGSGEDLRQEVAADDPRLAAWIEGRTGFPADRCQHARAARDRLAEFPHAGHADRVRRLPALDGLAPAGRKARSTFHRFRTGHSLSAGHRPGRPARPAPANGSQPGPALAAARPGWRLYPALGAGTCGLA